MWSHLILPYLYFTITFVQAFLPNDCSSPLPALPKYVESQCWKTWYLYASTVKCDNCCHIRKITQIGQARLKAVDFVKKPGEAKGINVTIVGQRDANDVNYRDDNGNSIVQIVGLDCDQYALLRLPNKIFEFWVRDPNSTIIDSVPNLKSCNATFYNYNPAKSCKIN